MTTGGGHRLSRRMVLLVVLAALLAFAFQGSRGLYETTEGRYAESAREMLETGDWLVPRLDYEPHWTKPPLTYWALAGGMALLGENEWGVRAAPAVAYLVIVATVFGLGAAMWGRRTAYVAALVYATCPFAVVAANSVSTDPFLAMWEALTALAYWKALRAGARSSRRWVVLLWLFAGLGFLTKGPPALLTLLAIFVYHGWRCSTRRPAPALTSPLGIPLFALVAFGWFIVVGVLHEGLLQHLISEEVVGRIADPGFNRNPEWYGPFVILLLPFTLGLGSWLFYWPHAWTRVRAWTGWRARVREVVARDAVFFCLLWAVVPMAVLLTSRSRLPLYVLPFVPALALVTGRAVVSRVAAAGRFRTVLRIAIVTAAVMLVVKGAAGRLESRSDIRPVYELIRSAGCDEGRVYAYGLQKEHGLMFYLGGKMVRVSADPVQPYAAMGAAELLAELSGSTRERSCCVVMKTKETALPELLTGAGLDITRRETSRYAVLTVSAGAAPQAQSAPEAGP
ncbi:MAG: glycosyltransferase family 39 protein [Candidatus Eisenbacteria bacterium]